MPRPAAVDEPARPSLLWRSIAAGDRWEEVFFFAGFVLDPDRAELLRPDGSVTRLRPKAFELLVFFAENSCRVIDKRDLMDAVWPGIHVGEDSLFQCIREIRQALGDADREMIKVVSGRGYLFAPEVSTEPPPEAVATEGKGGARRRKISVLALAVLGAVALALVVAFSTDRLFAPSRPVLELLPLAETRDASVPAGFAGGVAGQLLAGLSKIAAIDVVTPGADEAAGRATHRLQLDLHRTGSRWSLQARLVTVATGAVETVAEVETDASESDIRKGQARLAAGVGYAVAARLNRLAEPVDPVANRAGDVAIEQAIASINQITRERFATAVSILETYLAADPDSIDLKMALAGLRLRGIQLGWYDADAAAVAEKEARALLDEALRARPQSLPVLGAYCRFLTATNQFADSLVSCARTLSFNPWDGAALYNLGLTQIQLGRFEDALVTFMTADRYDTPASSRWTWLLGAGWANLRLGGNEEALPLLERSIAITPGSGRPYLLVATAQWRLGRKVEAREALAKALALRPGSTAANIALPTRNASEVFLAASNSVIATLVEVGLMEATGE